MLAYFKQIRINGFYFENEPKFEQELDIEHHDLIDGLWAAVAPGQIADGEIKLNLLVLIECLLGGLENAPKISEDDLANDISADAQIADQSAVMLLWTYCLFLLEQ